MTIVETRNIDIESLDVTSAKQVLPEYIPGNNGVLQDFSLQGQLEKMQ